MASIGFTAHLRAWAPTSACDYPGETVAEVLAAVARDYPRLPAYIFDDQGALRRHVAVFVDGRMIPRQSALDAALGPASEVYVFQALSGG